MAKDKSKGESDKTKKSAGEKPAEKSADKAEKAADKVEKAEKSAEKSAEKAEEKGEEKAAAKKGKKPEESKAARSKEKAKDHDHDEAKAGHGGHGHKVDRREYWVIFVVLFVLTVVEVGLAQIPGISKTLLAIGLIGLAVAKAACVGLYYMHLKHETKILRWSVAIPFSAPCIYALVLIAEGAWRLNRW